MATMSPTGGLRPINDGQYYQVVSIPYSESFAGYNQSTGKGTNQCEIYFYLDVSGQTVGQIAFTFSYRKLGVIPKDRNMSFSCHATIADISDRNRVNPRFITNGIGSWTSGEYSGGSGTCSVSISIDPPASGFTSTQVLAVWIHSDWGSATAPAQVLISSSGGTSDPGTGSGTGGGGSSSASDIVTASPSSPTGGASVTAGEDTEFRWSLSRKISSAEYYGTDLQYRTSSSGEAQSLGTASTSYTTYTKTGGFSSASNSMQWRARAKLFVSDAAFSASGYTVDQISSAGYSIKHYSTGQYMENGSEVGGGDEAPENGYLIIGKWSDWAAFSVIAATRPTASASPSSPTNSESVVAGEPVEFKWNLSKTGDGSYNGTQIHWRYEGTSNWTLIDAARAGIETYVYEDGFFPNKTVEWEARAKLDNSWGEWSETATFLVDTFPKAVASPSSPDGSTSVSGHAAVEFKWSLSKTGGSAAFDGSQLQYRYLESNIWTDLASVVAGITTYTYYEGFEPNSTVLWRVRAKLADANGEWGEWSEEKTFSVGPEYIFETTPKIVAPKSGNRNGGDSIVFAYDIQTSGTVTASQVEYSTDEGINWETLTTIEGRETEIRFSVPPLKFPSGAINWRVRAKANGEYSDWVEASFTVKYDAHGSIKMTNGPVNVGVLGSIPILFQGEMEREGISPDDILLSDAQLYWKSGSASEFSSIPMSIFGSRASIQVPEDTFPTGLLQWYIRAKDSTNTESETKVFTAYVLDSYADSFAIDPISVVKNAEDEILFQWGYITHNGQATVKTEIQFSTDGVDWDNPITVYEAGG